MAYIKKKPAKPGRKTTQTDASTPNGQQANIHADEQHSTLIGWVDEADDASQGSRELSEKCRGYYDTSGQWTDAERAKLKAQKQAATVINRIKPKVDALMGMERANRTTAKAQPRTPKHAGGALAATEAVRFCLQDNLYERQRSDAWENMLIEGTGGMEIIVQPKNESDYKIVIRQIMWDRLIYDPHSRRKDFSDAKFLGQVVWMDYDDALALYPEAKEVLEVMQDGSQTYDDKPRWMDHKRRRVKIVEMYYHKADGDWWYACFTHGGYCKEPMKSPYKNEEGETEHCYVFSSLFVDREGGRYGSLKQLLDVQDEINKRRSKALHLMSVRQTFGTAGAVADLNKARQELARPDGHVEFAYGELGKDFGVLPTGDMAQAQFNLLTEAKMEIDAVGANAASMGKDKTIQSGVALRQRALTGQTELAPMFDMLKNHDIRVYRKTWNRIKQYWKAEKWVRVTDDENNLKFVGLNKPVTQGEAVLQKAQEQGAPPEMIQALQAKIAADPMMRQIVSTDNEMVQLDVDIVMDDAPDTVTQEVEDFQAMAEMVKSGFPIPPEAVIMASPLSNKDKILKMMKEQPQLSPQHQKQMEQMQAQFQELQDESRKLARENQTLKQDQQIELAKLQQQQAEAQAEFELKRQTQASEIELKRLIAQAEHGLQINKMEIEHKAKKQEADFSMWSKHQSAMPPEVAVQTYHRKIAMEQEQAERIYASMQQFNESSIGMGQSLQQMGDLLQQILTLQQKYLEAMRAPRTVSIGSVRKDSQGHVVQASISTSIAANS